jgi:isoleucyl-tRNA synthetase
VHHCEYPKVDPAQIDEPLSFQMQVIKQIVTTAHALREQAGQRVRQPLAEIRVALGNKGPEYREALQRKQGLVKEELNIKDLVLVESLGTLTSISAKPNFAALGPRYGKDVQKIGAALAQAPRQLIEQLQSGQSVTLNTPDRQFELASTDVTVQIQTQPGWVVGDCGGMQLALNTTISPELRREGLAQDVKRHVQQLRKDLGLNIEDRIELAYATSDAELQQAIREWKDFLMAETLCVRLVEGSMGLAFKEIRIGDLVLRIEMNRI